MLETAIVEVSPSTVDDTTDDGVWIEALPARVYHTPQYGEVPITTDKLQRMITNFRQNVRGQEIATDYEHGLDQAKGLGASGWYRDFDIRPSTDDPTQMSLWTKVQFTDEAKQDIKSGKWKYWSLEWDDEYSTDNGYVVPDVIIGGGLTNRPVAKRTMPINFSEELWNGLDDDSKRMFAVWNASYVNNLPDSCFLYIETGGKKDNDGKTVPRSKRHLPYKDASGKIDLPHLRNAIARIPQMTGVSDALKSSLQAKARRLLGGQTKAASEQETRDAFSLLTERGFYVTLSEAAMEHSDPGIGAPIYEADAQPDPGTGQVVPRVTGDASNNDAAIPGMWRRDPLPNTSDLPGDEPETRQPSGRELDTGVITPGSTNFAEVADRRKFSDDSTYLNAAVKALNGYITEEDSEKDANDVQEAQTLVARIKALMEKENNEQESSDTVKAASEFIKRLLTKNGGSRMELSEQHVATLRELGLDFADDADADALVEVARTAFSEMTELRRNVSAASQEHEFAEKYPALWSEHQKLLDTNRANEARAFAESCSRINKAVGTGDEIKYEPTRDGLSARALEQIADVHKKFSEGKATIADFEESVKAIVNGGLVHFGEVGSSGIGEEPVAVDVTTATGVAAARRLFAEKVAEAQKDNAEISYEQAIAKAAEKYPEIAAAYRATA